MSFANQSEHDLPAASAGAEADLTGRDRLVGNVLASWAGHFVFIVAGFIMPRMIDRRLGQDLLGVWDFAWSLVAYFGLVQAGIGSSVNRYVAKCRAVGDIDGVNRAVSSVWVFLLLAGAVVLALTAAASLLLPSLFGNRLGGSVVTAQWVVFVLGLKVALRLNFGAFSGVVSGCHRWGLHNAITAGFYAAVAAGMIVSLYLGGGLISLAAVSLVGLLAGDFSEAMAAHRVCPGLYVRPSLATWRQTRSMLTFGGKTLIPSIGQLLLHQTVNILIVAYLGPAALALFARPLSLIRHLQTLLAKLSHVLVPTAGALDGAAKAEKLRSLLIRSVRYALYIALPATLVLVAFGDVILGIWMGPRYQNRAVLAILALGFLPTIAHMPALSILAGMNAHGRPGIAYLAAAVLAVGLTVVALGPLDLALAGAAAAVAIPLALANGIYLPVYACRRVGLPLGRYARKALRGPLSCALPFSLCLFGARGLLPDNPQAAAAWGCTLGFLVLAALYWVYVLPERIRAVAYRLVSIGKAPT